MLPALFGLVCLANFVCAVIVWIKMFQNEGALKGVLGVICMLYALIWGWMNANKLNLKTIMMAWTALFVLLIILEVVVGGAMFSAGMSR
jgi:hypothetical protein